jgi:hypothetical protein
MLVINIIVFVIIIVIMATRTSNDTSVAKQRRDDDDNEMNTLPIKSIMECIDQDGKLNIIQYLMYCCYKKRITKQQQKVTRSIIIFLKVHLDCTLQKFNRKLLTTTHS